jgi:chemotaxis response regulator CheB
MCDEDFDSDRFSRDIGEIRARLKHTSAIGHSTLDALAERQKQASDGPPISIVFADDDERYRHLLRALLHAYPRFRIAGEAADGQQAIAVTIAQRPRVVLLDVGMPGVDGVDAATAILHALPSAHVVLHTGEVHEERVAYARRLGLEVVDKLAINDTLDHIAAELDRV